MSYRGIVARIPIGLQGFTGTLNPSQAGPGHLLFVDGAELDRSIIRKEGGATKFNSVALGEGAKIISGINWSPAPTVHYDVVFLDTGEIVRDTGAGTFSTSLVNGLNVTQDPPPWFAVAGGETVGAARKLLCFSAVNQVHVVSGTGDTMVPISNPATDWASSFPTFGIQHGTRVFAGGNPSDPHRIYYSTTSDHTDFTGSGSGSVAIFPGEGDEIVGALSFRGALIVFKYPSGIYIINTVDPAPVNWVVAPLTRSVGTLNQHTIVPVENDVIYMDRLGDIHALSATNEFGDINTSNLGGFQDISPFMRSSMNLGAMRRCQGLWYAGRRQAWFAMPLIGSVDNNFRFIIDMNNVDQDGNRVPRFFMSRRDRPLSLWMRHQSDQYEKPVHGDDEGFLWTMDEDARNKGGEAYPIRLETASTDLAFIDQSIATRQKTGQFLELAYEPRGDWLLDVEVYWDDVLSEVIQFSMGAGSGASLGEFQLDSDILVSSNVRSQRKRLSGSGRRVKFVIENGGVNQDVSLSEFHLSFVVNDERIQ